MTVVQPDWARWWQRFEEQQTYHIPRREQRFELMLELVGDVTDGRPRLVLDLACGTGAISQRVLQRFSSTQVVALDLDPLLLAIGQHALGDGDGRLRWVRADLRTPDWATTLEPLAPFDAVLSSTALHWLGAGELVAVYRQVAGLLRPGGLLLNAEHLLVGPPGRPLATLTERLRQRLVTEGAAAGGESWPDWWRAAETEEPAFAELLAERARAFGERDLHEHIPSQFHETALALAGFADTAVVWRYLDDTIVAGVR